MGTIYDRPHPHPLPRRPAPIRRGLCRAVFGGGDDFMNCPYCNKKVFGFTGLQEAQKFQKHLNKCRKNPANAVLSDGETTVMTPKRHSILDALEIRAESGQ